MKIIKINSLWCSGCIIMNKILQKIETEIPNLEIINLDYDFNEEEIKKYNVGKKLPVIILLDQNDKEITRLIGESSHKKLKELIESNMSK